MSDRTEELLLRCSQYLWDLLEEWDWRQRSVKENREAFTKLEALAREVDMHVESLHL